MRLLILIFLILTFSGPLLILASGRIDFAADYRTANRDSAKIAPIATDVDEAMIQVYSARAFNWRGIFAVHTWIAVKPKGAKHYITYQVIGWRVFRNLPALAIMQDLPDRNWFNQKPIIIFELRGEKAEKIIPDIMKAAESYPYPNSYLTWPGPNSNTFTAYVGRQIPDMHLVLPSDAIGKDYFPDSAFFARAVSGTGYQFSLYGLLGVTVASREGLEINFLGLVYGFSPYLGTIKLPGFGDIHLF